MYIVIAILAFVILILTHELGHFVAAKACGVKVLEFSLGMGPLLLKKQGKETLYSLRLLPLGGFCAMEGEDEDSDDPRAFSSQKPWKKIIILIAGAAMNFLFGFLLVLIVYSGAKGFSSPTVTGFMDGCPYQGESAVMEGDSFYKIDGHRIYFTTNIADYMSRSGSDYHDIVLKRGSEKVELDDFYMPLVEYTKEDGTPDMKYGFYFGTAEATFGNYLKYSWYCTIDFVRLVWRSLGDLVTGNVSLKELSGPVGIVDFVNDVAEETAASGTVADAVSNILYIFALIAVNLAVMNMLPIPALDGGRVFLLIVTSIIELITRKRVNPKYEGYIHTAGFVLLMGLMVFVMFNDIWKLFK